MDFEEISNRAYKQEGVEATCNLAVKYAYLQMKELYTDYKNSKVSKDDAEKKKTEIKKDYEVNIRQVEKYKEVLQRDSKLQAKYEEYLYAIEKSQKPEELLENSLKFIEYIIQDKSFFERNSNKIS